MLVSHPATNSSSARSAQSQTMQTSQLETSAEQPLHPEQHAAAGLAAIVGKLQGLKPFPESAQRLLLVVWDPEHDSNEVVKIIERDPTLTAKVLRLVNSAAFGLKKVCESISRAVVLLGSRSVAEVAVAQIALSQFDDAGPTSRLIADHCQLVGQLCRKLASRRRLLRSIDVFTPGILHDLGKLLMLQVDQGEYEQLFLSTPLEPDVMHEVEHAHYGYDHAVLAEHVMVDWRLPDVLRDIIRAHHDPKTAASLSPALQEAVHVLRASDRLSYLLVKNVAPSPELLERLATLREFQALELDTERLAQLWPDFVSLIKR
jgi:HD-like signal output (HDOD) protein